MKSDCFKCLLVGILFAQVFCIPLINAEFDEDSWMDPDAWARDHLANGISQARNSKCCRCTDNQVDHVNTEQPLQESRAANAEDVASSVYFKKFVTMLFNRKNFKFDSTKQHFERSIVFIINSHQMDKLEQSQDPRDLDNTLIEVFNNVAANNINYHGEGLRETATAFKTIVFNILYETVRQLTRTSEMRFFLIVISVILITWLINKRLKISWWLLISGGVFTFGYFHTYLECNRELEVNRMLEMLNSGTENENNINNSKLFNFFKGLFNSDDIKIRQQQNIRQSAKLRIEFCRPDHVFIMYINDLFLKYIKVLIEQCTVTITSLNGSLGFPYNLFTPIFVVYIFLYILKLAFKYILRPPWSQLLHQKHQTEKVLKNPSNSEDDRISGDNLKLLLTAINAAPLKKNVESELQDSSGVEEVKEAIQSSSEKSLQKVDKDTSEKVQNNNVSNKRLSSDEKTDAKIENLSFYS